MFFLSWEPGQNLPAFQGLRKNALTGICQGGRGGLSTGK